MTLSNIIEHFKKINEKNDIDILKSFFLTFKNSFENIMSKEISIEETKKRVNNTNILRGENIDGFKIEKFESDLESISKIIIHYIDELLENKNISDEIKNYLLNIKEDFFYKISAVKNIYFLKLKVSGILNNDKNNLDIIKTLDIINQNLYEYKKGFKKIIFLYNFFIKRYSKFLGDDFIKKVDSKEMSYYNKFKFVIIYKEAYVEISEFIKKYYIDISKNNLLKNSQNLTEDILFEKAIKKLNIVFLKKPENILKQKNELSKHNLVSGIFFESLKDEGLDFSDLEKFGFKLEKINSGDMDKKNKNKIKRYLISLYEENYENKSFISEMKLEINKKLKHNNTDFYILFHDNKAIFSSVLKYENNENTINWSAFNSAKNFQNFGFGFWFLDEKIKEIGEDYNITCEVNYKLNGNEDRMNKILEKAYGAYGFELIGGVKKGKHSKYQKLIRKKRVNKTKKD